MSASTNALYSLKIIIVYYNYGYNSRLLTEVIYERSPDPYIDTNLLLNCVTGV